MNIRRLTSQAIVLGLLLLIIHFVASTGLGKTKKVSSTNWEILGITLGSSTNQDVERVLGPAEDMSPPQSELSKVCYVSSAADGTVLEFVIWDKPVGFRFFRALPEASQRCTRSALVSDSLKTSSGLKLGMYRSKIISMFGPPAETHGDKYIYDFSFDRPLTPEERERYRNATPLVSAVSVTEKIEFGLKGSKVDLIDVTYSVTF